MSSLNYIQNRRRYGEAALVNSIGLSDLMLISQLSPCTLLCMTVHKSLLGHTVYISDLLTSVADVSAARLVVWWPRRAADPSTNRRQGFLCRRTASMEQAADRAEAAAVDHYFSSTENISVPVCLRTPGRLMIVLWCALGV